MKGIICTGFLVTLVTIFSATHVGAVDPVFPFNVFDYFNMPSMFSPDMFVPWYKGSNVCVDEKREPVQDYFSDLSPSVNSRDVSENCKGDNEKYICVSRITENGETTQKISTYQCSDKTLLSYHTLQEELNEEIQYKRIKLAF
ncbi:hypothetical protein NPIL_326781 [Nephila pilipes]|uniref:Spider venom protein n=1 Tax=Nephila pilipes TaxID=299642 RepID=A0A8X6TKX6_NEPPI|nr:hypothetical protein NPIL_326781 [Nephila pilipes]